MDRVTIRCPQVTLQIKLVILFIQQTSVELYSEEHSSEDINGCTQQPSWVHLVRRWLPFHWEGVSYTSGNA